jgi:beta-mannanase
VPSRRPAAAALLLVLLAGCSAPSTSPTPPPDEVVSPVGGSALAPAEGAYLGLYYGDRPPEETDAAVGRTPQVHLTYVGWEDDWPRSAEVRGDVDRGQVSLVSWEPFGVDLADVVAGRHDAMLRERARAAARLERPVLLDLAAEMNEEEGWGGHDPGLYVAFYRHVHDVVAPVAGDRVEWVWAPNNVDSPGAPPALDYYPGDAYVDWTGIDGYNWGTEDDDHAWESFADVMGPMYEELEPLGKPVIVAETSSAEDGGSKAAWVAEVVPSLREEMPAVRALVWFDVDKERDWRIGSSPGAEAAVRALAADPYLAAEVP